MSKIDPELKKAFTELQQKALDTSQKLKIADIQIDGYKKSKQHAAATGRELDKLDASTKMYESVGRAFFLESQNTIKENLTTKQTKLQDKIVALENNKVYLERSLKDSENNLREMVQQRK